MKRFKFNFYPPIVHKDNPAILGYQKPAQGLWNFKQLSNLVFVSSLITQDFQEPPNFLFYGFHSFYSTLNL